MSKRATRIPAPLPRLVPSVIRSFGPRLLLVVMGCTILLMLSGGSYLLAHTILAPKPSVAIKPAAKKQDGQQAQQVLGAATSASAPTPPSESLASTPAPSSASSSKPASNLQSVNGKASFDVSVNASQITQAVTGLITVPFTVLRHGNVPNPVAPSTVTVYANGSLTNLITVQSAVMQSPDSGVITLAPVGLFPRDITVQLSAKSGSLTGGTSFSYHISL